VELSGGPERLYLETGAERKKDSLHRVCLNGGGLIKTDDKGVVPGGKNRGVPPIKKSSTLLPDVRSQWTQKKNERDIGQHKFRIYVRKVLREILHIAAWRLSGKLCGGKKQRLKDPFKGAGAQKRTRWTLLTSACSSDAQK